MPKTIQPTDWITSEMPTEATTSCSHWPRRERKIPRSTARPSSTDKSAMAARVGTSGRPAEHVEIEHRHRAQHVDLAVREVDDVQDAVDQRESEGHEDVEDSR